MNGGEAVPFFSLWRNAMPFIPVPNTVEVEVIFEMQDQVVENTLYYANETPSLENVTSLLEEINTAIQDQLIPLLSSAITLVRLVATLISVVDGFVVTNTTGMPVSGGGSDDALPSNVALCISKRTALRGRSARGRNYIAGIPLDARETQDTLTSAFTSGVVSAFETILGAGADGGWVPVVVSRFHSGAPRTTGVTNPITNVIVTDNIMDSQRRRLPGRGA
jgi:hypothetical protein